MKDILYKWQDGITSVGISREVQLPQFKVLGHRQRQTDISLTTGNFNSYSYLFQIRVVAKVYRNRVCNQKTYRSAAI